MEFADPLGFAPACSCRMMTEPRMRPRDVEAPEPPDGVEALVRRHQAAVWRYLRVLGADRETADELLQETFVVLLRGGFEVRSDAATRGYLRETARRLWLGDRRRRRAVREVEEADLVWHGAVGEGDGQEQVEALRRCLDGLAPRARTALIACRVEERRRDDVAAELGLEVEGLKTLLRRTLDGLRDCMTRRTRDGR